MGARQGQGLLSVAYLDASAAVKLFRREVGSAELRDEFARWSTRAANEILAVEVRCVARRGGSPGDREAVERLLTQVELLPWETDIAERAGTIAFTPALRALDAVHLTTALSLRDDLGVLLAYDRELLKAAAAEGLPTASPGWPSGLPGQA